MMGYVYLTIIGATAGVLSGLLGIGGGIVMIPALVYFLGYSQQLAQGTTLAAMVFPIGILASIEYYKKGYVNISAALIIAAVFVIGGLIGAKFAVRMDSSILKKIFAVFLIAVAVKTLMEK
jgi:hypothetical protein